jgi:opacity protein-like surface antigen
MFNVQKVLLLGAALVLGSALNASAADLGGNLNEAPQMAPMPAPSAGWYARVDGGYTLFTDPTIDAGGTITRTTNTGIDNAWSVGGGIGRYFGRGFRGDITVDHLFDATTEGSMYCECGTFLGDAKFDFSSTVLLANLYYDFNRGGRIVPYIGAGIGFAHNETSSGSMGQDCGCTSRIGGDSSNSFAAAGMAGVSWRIRGGGTTYVGGMKDEPVAYNTGHAIYLDFGYRFLYLGDVRTGDISIDGSDVAAGPKLKDVTTHQFRVGLRYDLN